MDLSFNFNSLGGPLNKTLVRISFESRFFATTAFLHSCNVSSQTQKNNPPLQHFLSRYIFHYITDSYTIKIDNKSVIGMLLEVLVSPVSNK